MVDKRLVDYIKKHHKDGHSYHYLHDYLVHHGHSAHSVNEAMNAAKAEAHHKAHRPRKKRSKKPLFGVLALVILAGVVIALVFGTRGIKDCKEDMDCFIDAASECRPAMVTMVNSVDLFGLVATSTTLIETRGLDDFDRCIYYDRQLDTSVEFSDELKENMLSQGKTEQEIRAQEALANEAAKLAAGIQKICKFPVDELTAMLERWKQGSFSGGASCSLADGECQLTGDFENKDCDVIA
jgi:hypothetical protein